MIKKLKEAGLGYSVEEELTIDRFGKALDRSQNTSTSQRFTASSISIGLIGSVWQGCKTKTRMSTFKT